MNLKTIQKVFDNNLVVIIIAVILLPILIRCIYVYSTPFSRTITIKQKNDYSRGRTISNTVADANGEVYEVANSYPVLHFTASENWSSLEAGKSYKVTGNGIRIPILSLYPNIVTLTPTN
jgi:hypothetical protein